MDKSSDKEKPLVSKEDSDRVFETRKKFEESLSIVREKKAENLEHNKNIKQQNQNKVKI